MNLKLTSLTIALSMALSQSAFADSSRVYSSTNVERNVSFTPSATNNGVINQTNVVIKRNFDSGQTINKNFATANFVENTYKNDTPKYEGVEDKAGKTLMCLLAGGLAPSACKGLLKDYFKMVANPKKYGNPAAFLAKSPTRSGKAHSDAEKSRQKQMDRYTKSIGENKQKTSNELWGYDISKFEKMSMKQSNSYVDSMDMNYGWKNKHRKFLGVDSEGNSRSYFSCDVDAETGLNTKMETREERYREDGRTRYRYYLRTLTEMPHNCSSLKAHYPMTILPEYDSAKCDGRWYNADDYLHGYYLKVVGYKGYGDNREPIYEKVKIEKECWYIDSNKQKAMEDNYKKAQEKLLEQGLNERWTPDYLNTKMFNLTMPSKFKLPEPTNKFIKTNVVSSSQKLNNQTKETGTQKRSYWGVASDSADVESMVSSENKTNVQTKPQEKQQRSYWGTGSGPSTVAQKPNNQPQEKPKRSYWGVASDSVDVESRVSSENKTNVQSQPTKKQQFYWGAGEGPSTVAEKP